MTPTEPAATASPLEGADLVDRASKWVDLAEEEFERDKRISRARMALMAAAVLLGVSVLDGAISPLWPLLPLGVFLVLLVLHGRTIDRAHRAYRVADFYRRAYRRVERDLSGPTTKTGPTDSRWRITIEGGEITAEETDPDAEDEAEEAAAKKKSASDAEEEEELALHRRRRVRRLQGRHHASHLEMFPPGGLFDRISDRRTDYGGETLAQWLLQPAGAEEARSRQEAIRELIPNYALRERLAATGSMYRWPKKNEGPMRRWIASHRAPGQNASRYGLRAGDPPFIGLVGYFAAPLSLGMLVGLAGFAFGVIGPTLYLAFVVYSLGLGLWSRKWVELHDLYGQLGKMELEALLLQLEALGDGSGFKSARLRELSKRLEGAEDAFRRLQRLFSMIRLRKNPMFAPISATLFFGTWCALALERWRGRRLEDVPKWLEAMGEFDALVALAQYASERPAHAFATFDEKPGLVAVDVGHPLIPEEVLARNTVRLGNGRPDFLIVTGSNMSGKSTLLRTLGVNFVLARMGAPVSATEFRIGPMTLGTSISIADSLQDGISHFLAELYALRTVLEAGTESEPLFFLVDEVLHGTNSNDRRAAVGALFREISRRAAIGIITTHDMALTELAHEMPDRVENRHFVDHISGRGLQFDYQLRPGVLPRGNALDLMRILDLPVPEDESGGDSGGGEFTSLPDETGKEH